MRWIAYNDCLETVVRARAHWSCHYRVNKYKCNSIMLSSGFLHPIPLEVPAISRCSVDMSVRPTFWFNTVYGIAPQRENNSH
jgi:hypothetical protein